MFDAAVLPSARCRNMVVLVWQFPYPLRLVGRVSYRPRDGHNGEKEEEMMESLTNNDAEDDEGA